MKREKKDFCRYAVFDGKTGVMLACGEKYKVNRGLNYDGSFRPWSAGFRRIAEYSRHAVIKGRAVNIFYWYNTCVRKPFRTVTPAGAVLGLS